MEGLHLILFGGRVVASPDSMPSPGVKPSGCVLGNSGLGLEGGLELGGDGLETLSLLLWLACQASKSSHPW